MKKKKNNYENTWEQIILILKIYYLKNGKYKLDEVIEKFQSNQKILGEYEGDEVIMKMGKFGPYIFYKTTSMKKPKFLPLKKCPLKYEDCDENEMKMVFTGIRHFKH